MNNGLNEGSHNNNNKEAACEHLKEMATNICPSCHGFWYEDIEEETGRPYTCYTCCNGTIKNFEDENDHKKRLAKKSTLGRKRSKDSPNEW